MRELWKKFWPLLIGYGISLVLGGVFYFVSKEVRDSVVITLLGSILTTIFGILVDMTKNQDVVLAALDISKYLNNDDKLRGNLYKLTNDYVAATSKQNDKLFVEEAQKTFEHCIRVVAELSKGKFYAETEEKRADFIRSKMRDPGVKSFKAITVLSKGDPDWWFDEHGREYIEEQKKAIDRGAKVARIIIEPKEPPPTLDLSALISAQKEAGIEVMTVREKGLPSGLCANILICVDKWVTESHFDGTGNHDGGWVSTDKTNVSLAIQKWDRLINLARGNSN